MKFMLRPIGSSRNSAPLDCGCGAVPGRHPAEKEIQAVEGASPGAGSCIDTETPTSARSMSSWMPGTWDRSGDQPGQGEAGREEHAARVVGRAAQVEGRPRSPRSRSPRSAGRRTTAQSAGRPSKKGGPNSKIVAPCGQPRRCRRRSSRPRTRRCAGRAPRPEPQRSAVVTSRLC